MEEIEENFLVSNEVTKIIKNTHTPRGSLTTLVYYSMPSMGMVPRTCVQKPREKKKRRRQYTSALDLLGGIAMAILVFLPGESHGQRNLAGYSPWGRKGQT